MKQLMVYTRKDGKLTEELEVLIKLQIDNAKDFCGTEDLILAMNFNYEYGGVKSLIIPDTSYVREPECNKIPAIVYLLQNNMLPNETIWYHDCDAYQDKEMDIDSDLALVSYGYKPQWNCGSFFFSPKSKPEFELLLSKMITKNRADERTLTALTNSGEIKGFDELGVEYNYTQILYDFPKYDNVVPRVLHFHPNYKFYRAKETNLNIFMYGKSRLNRPIMSDRLINIFHKYKIK